LFGDLNLGSCQTKTVIEPILIRFAGNGVQGQIVG
jgi:hypothetical protein